MPPLALICVNCPIVLICGSSQLVPASRLHIVLAVISIWHNKRHSCGVIVMTHIVLFIVVFVIMGFNFCSVHRYLEIIPNFLHVRNISCKMRPCCSKIVNIFLQNFRSICCRVYSDRDELVINIF